MNRTFVCILVAVAGIVFGADAAPYTNAAVPKLIKQDNQGYVLLHGSNVNIHGSTVRYEAATNKLTIGYWTKVEDWVHWDFEITKPGILAMEILQGCGAGSGDSVVEFVVAPKGGKPEDEQKISHTVRVTGGFQKFVSMDIGSVNFAKPGNYTLSVKPQSKPGMAVMDLRLVILKPLPRIDPPIEEEKELPPQPQ
jgi:hypothetical protein